MCKKYTCQCAWLRVLLSCKRACACSLRCRIETAHVIVNRSNAQIELSLCAASPVQVCPALLSSRSCFAREWRPIAARAAPRRCSKQQHVSHVHHTPLTSSTAHLSRATKSSMRPSKNCQRRSNVAPSACKQVTVSCCSVTTTSSSSSTSFPAASQFVLHTVLQPTTHPRRAGACREQPPLHRNRFNMQRWAQTQGAQQTHPQRSSCC